MRTWLRRWRNVWISLAFLLAWGLAWIGSTARQVDWPEAVPQLDPEIAAIREKVIAGESAGESFSIVVTEQSASDAVAWFLRRHPRVPFSRPWVEIGPDGLTGRGLAHLFGLNAPVYGRASIVLRDGAPVITLHELGVAGAVVPGFVRQAIQSEVESQFDFWQDNPPVEIRRLEFGAGTMTVEGVYR
ncbi:MAG: hypothetical protein JXA37_08615 [Chloroflexia bacterium]|nr:hypothetical protein [Chloroflexia bacterium]